MVISVVVSFIPLTDEEIEKISHQSMQNIFRLSPSFCFADGLASLALRRQGIKYGSGTHTLDWNVTGASICYLGIEVTLEFIFCSSFYSKF